jgi:CheY-like chemotaxis protein
MTVAETGRRDLLMIVEDDGSTRLALGAVFARRGWEVALASSVGDALDQLEHGPEPCGIILDLTLPDDGGEALLRHVRDAGLGSRVVVYTGTIEPLRLMRVRDLRPDLLVIKPLDPDVLCTLFDDWCQPA